MLLKDNIYTLALKTQQRLLWGGTLDFVRKEILQINLQTCCHEIHFRLQQGLAPWPEDISRWYLFTIYTNAFPFLNKYNINLYKYNLQYGQIRFTIWTNKFCSWAQLGAVTRRHFPVISFYVAAQLRADWKEEDYFSAFLYDITNPIPTQKSMVIHQTRGD